MEAAIFDDLTALADATRSRMLLVLERHELTVGELCAVLQLPQSTVSRHLKTLADAGWVASRRDGTSRYYTLALDERDVSDAAAVDAAARAGRPDARRRPGRRRLQGRAGHAADEVAGVLRVGGRAVGPAARRRCSGAPRICRRSRRCWIDAWVVGDLGCGTGQVAAALAPFVAAVVAVDRSGDMLQAARRRLRGPAERRRPARRARGAADRGRASSTRRRCCSCCTTCRIRPRRSREAARVLRPGGRLLICDMLPHDREEYRQQMGHVWLGFGEDQMRQPARRRGLRGRSRIVPLAADPAAKGPALFVASALRA